MRAGVDVQEVPRFGLAALAGADHGLGLGVVGVDLDAEPVAAVEELDEEGKAGGGVEAGAEELPRVSVEEVLHGVAGEGTGGDDAVAVGDPGLADGGVADGGARRSPPQTRA
ncbi:hypothetical protein GCM10008960_32940 [Deinococcus sedimenti]|uniref:Uncharacterized protein n=1 Tax=Deinococcus sedimenti TaxID=1867090 RepID=A0ABQ2S9W1_9DEIO|nr:hypothetical protein GCM10008960_32940 [Deinococcus sedimenti]